jgi:hypothetical protein
MSESDFSSESEAYDNSPSPKKKKKVKKKPKKKPIPNLPNRVIIIKNSEKDTGGWNESWNKPKHRNIAHIPHPFRLLALGRPGRGKTNMIKNIFLKHQSSNKPFVKLYVMTCDEDSTEWNDCDPNEVSTQLPDVDFFDPKYKTALVIDDFEFARMSKIEVRRLSTIMRFVSTHRNVSVMLGFQSFFDCPNICRKTANCFMIYKPVSKIELVTIANRVGVDADDLKMIFKTICTTPYDHLFVDRTISTPYFLRKNIYKQIHLNDSDSD